MRTICGLVGLAAAGFLAASAHGVNVPTVSTPTVTAPSVSVPSVPLPKPTLPAPTVPAPTTAPVPVPPAPKPTLPQTTVAAPTPAATTAPEVTAPAPVSSAATGTSAAVTGGGAQPPTAASPGGSRPAPAPARSYGVAGASHTTHRGRAQSSLPQLRRVIARFTLERPARVLISIEELAPVCRKLRTYIVQLPKGTHAFRFPLTHVTEVGTYRVTALLRNHKIFSVRARRMHTRVKLGGTANVCRTLTTRTAFSLSTLGTLGATGFPAAAGKGKSSSGQLHVKAAHGRRSAAPHTSGAQPPQKNPLVRAVSLTDAPHSLQPLLFTLLAIAIMLLALAAAPQRVLPAGRAAAIVATRRAYFAAAGIWLLVVVAIVTAFA